MNPKGIRTMEKFESQSESSEVKEKQALWNRTIEELDRVVDKLGKPIDAGIKETVAAFIVNKFPINGSCEGHVEERFDKKIKLRPYIAVGMDEPRQRFVGESEIKERIAAEHGITSEDLEDSETAERAYWDYIHKQDVPETPEFLEIRAKNEELLQSIQQVLEVFYKNRQALEDTKLTIERIGPAGHFRVITAKENPKGVQDADIEKHQQQLLAEQEEVRALTQFLKEKFFG